MFDFLKKPEFDANAAREFWAWFIEREDWIIDCIAHHKADFIWELDARLKPVFPYFKKELEFQLGFQDGKGEFFFFHFGNKALTRDGQALGSLMPRELSGRWTFLLEK